MVGLIGNPQPEIAAASSTNGPAGRPKRVFARLTPPPIITISSVGSPSLPIGDRVRTPDHPSRDAPAPSGASACLDRQSSLESLLSGYAAYRFSSGPTVTSDITVIKSSPLRSPRSSPEPHESGSDQYSSMSSLPRSLRAWSGRRPARHRWCAPSEPLSGHTASPFPISTGTAFA